MSLRKSKREESVQKRRHIAAASQNSMVMSGSVGSNDPSLHVNSNHLPDYVRLLYSDNFDDQEKGSLCIRKLLSAEKNPPIDAVIATGAISRLVELLANHNRPTLQFEACWALTNIASGTSEQTRLVLDAGALPHFVAMMASPSSDVSEQAVWAVGNIAGDSASLRDLCLGEGAMRSLLYLLNNRGGNGGHPPMTLLRTGVWTLSNLCRGKPRPPFPAVSFCLPTLNQILQTTNDEETLVDCCWALSYLTDGPDEEIEQVVKTGACQKLVPLLGESRNSILTPALRTAGNIVTGNDELTQHMIDLDFVPSLARLLDHSSRNIRKEATWALSNITAGNEQQTDVVLRAGLFPRLVSMLSNDSFDVKKECAWAISNATTWKSVTQVNHLVDSGVVAPLCDMLGKGDVRIVTVALDAIENILHVGVVDDPKLIRQFGGPNRFTMIFEEAEGIEKIENLQEHENEDVYRRAVGVIETFFGVEDEVENQTPNQQQHYVFSHPLPPSTGFIF